MLYVHAQTLVDVLQAETSSLYLSLHTCISIHIRGSILNEIVMLCSNKFWILEEKKGML